MRRSAFKISLALGLLPACCFDEAGESFVSQDGSSSESGDGSQSSTSVTTTVTTSATTTSSASSETSSDDGSSSDGTETFGESATTTIGEESSTGEVIEDWALAFTGANLVTSDPFMWTSDEITVEAWIEIQDTDATGILIDAQDPFGATGWTLYIHNDWHAFTFSFFDAAAIQQLVVGPAIDDVGTGWHHVAATKNGGQVYIHVDGVSWNPVPVSSMMSSSMNAISLGDRPDGQGLSLEGMTIDDVRISDLAIYTNDFIPEVDFAVEASTVVLLDFDEGTGDQAHDQVSALTFSIETPDWVVGYAG